MRRAREGRLTSIKDGAAAARDDAVGIA